MKIVLKIQNAEERRRGAKNRPLDKQTELKMERGKVQRHLFFFLVVTKV